MSKYYPRIILFLILIVYMLIVDNNLTIKITSIILLILFVSVLTTYNTKDSKQIITDKIFIKQDSRNSSYKSIDILSNGLTIKVLGEFRLWVDGREIHYKDWRSKKSRELFLYLLLKNHYGASIDDINQIFWPDVNSASANNSRAVALNKIRNVIAPYGAIISKVDNRLKIDANDFISCDFLHLYQFLKNENGLGQFDEKYPMSLFGSDGILPDLHADWVEYIRTDTINSLIKYSKKLGKQYINNKNWDDLVWVGEKILEYEPLDDNGLTFAIIGYKNQMKDGLAHKIYRDYCLNYKLELGEMYSIDYDTIGKF